MEFVYPPGATPLDPDEMVGLIPRHITNQADLNAWEQANIALADRWATRQKKRALLEESFVRDLHRFMFDKTWQWAGTFRKSNKNIGVDWSQVAVKLRNLLDNTQYQIENRILDVDEIAVRFHHQLVLIHPFPNGNGRHARLMADWLSIRLGQPRFTWGHKQLNLSHMSSIRNQYISALRAADQGQIDALLMFARN